MRALATVALLFFAGVNAQASNTPTTTTPPASNSNTASKSTDTKDKCVESTVDQVDIGATNPSTDLCNGGRFKVYTPVVSFTTMNNDQNAPSPVGRIIMIIGFVLFGLAYLYTVVMIFVDTANRDKETMELLENDEQQIKRLNIDTTHKDFVEGLEEKLLGIKADDKGDDQLYGTAAKLSDSEWRAGV